MNLNQDKYHHRIEIKGASHKELKQALNQWITLYAEDLHEDYNFKLFLTDQGPNMIYADKELDQLYFFFLINYLKYPENIKYKAEVRGYFIDEKSKELQMVFIPSDDKEYDFVNISDQSNTTRKFSFDCKEKPLAEYTSFIPPSNIVGKKLEVIKEPLKAQEPEKKKSKIKNQKLKTGKEKTKRRFKYFSILFLSLIFVAGVLEQGPYINSVQFVKVIGVGLFFWLFLDNKLLKDLMLYASSLMIGFAYFIVVWLLYKNSVGEEFKFVHVVSLGPIVMQVIHQPLRHLYKLIFNREPDGNPTFFERLYYLVLMLCTLFVVTQVSDYFWG